MSAVFKDYYASLGVARDASADDIKKAFRKLARKHHPDVAGHQPGSESRFKEINEANEVLSDPDKREKYDRLGANWQHGDSVPPSPGPGPGPDQEFHFGGTGFSDFFEQYFSGGSRYGFPHADDPADFGSAGPAHPRRGSDIEGDILVTLEEAMQGTERPLSLQILNRRTGKAETRSFTVRIPPGAVDGRRIRVPGQGEPGRGGAPAGDLFLRVRHAAHPDFTSEETDILHDLDIAPWEAVLGAEVVVPTLEGPIKLKIPPGSENGQKLRARGRGLPVGKTGARGDYYVVLRVQLPATVPEGERALWEKLREGSSFQARAPRQP